MKRLIFLFFFFVVLIPCVQAQEPVVTFEHKRSGKRVALFMPESKMWIKTTDKRRLSGYVFDYRDSVFHLLSYAEHSGAMAESKKLEWKTIQASDSLTSVQKQTAYLTIYYTDTLRVHLSAIRKIGVENRFMKKHRKLVNATGITGLAVLGATGITSYIDPDAETLLIASGTTGAALCVAYAVMARQKKINLRRPIWSVY